ncbi:hypothetical protein Kpol_1065p24 [Vanderwaltozyma polyspora DSM 70294]|uniref:Uncharacterized protein n=1 Tax=Vanderwaltozyma polyspora (strain ATCC 22028 / DSM 70294 / BCRC 21397 / CBS 2163 / NBRC 10782 / NRRL Y-8283 / UCD 57-17) TaxID=436907 RepID=A7TL46_VANPO|nr:uncharacterized protein Kpol_1065p24 [Vanderwaltozyma polyspora DSM 70294]EDO17009.1 hypothetical protein Kpol_1065p24 [Vanderwaltozyma polyspora DSM 70294]
MGLNNVTRPDLAVRYNHAPLPRDSSVATAGFAGVINQSMPMAAMFLRNKFVAWFALIQSFHYYLNIDSDDIAKMKKADSNGMDQPPSIRVLLSLVSLIVSYLELIYPQPAPPLPTDNASKSEETNTATE